MLIVSNKVILTDKYLLLNLISMFFVKIENIVK
jgi:hypothetical protein